jgi:hypothetical protein
MVMVYGLGLKKRVDERKPENKKREDYANSERRTLPKLSNDPVNIE